MNKIHLTAIFSREFAKFYHIGCEVRLLSVFFCRLIHIAVDLAGLISQR